MDSKENKNTNCGICRSETKVCKGNRVEDGKRGRIKMSEKYKAWTAEEIELLKSFMAKGEKTSVIAIRLQRPHGSVTVKKREIESGNMRTGSFWTVDETKMLKALLQKDLSKGQIAEIMGRSESSIKNRLIKMGVDIWNEDSYQAYVC